MSKVFVCKEKDDSPKNSYSLLQRRTKESELQQVTPYIKLSLNELINFVQEFKSRRASLGVSVFIVVKVCSVVSLGKLTKSHLWKELSKKNCLTGPKSLALINMDNLVTGPPSMVQLTARDSSLI